MRQKHYRLVGLDPAPAFALPPGYTGRFWAPSLRKPLLPGLPALPFAGWTAMHHLRVFRNRLFAVYLVTRAGRLVHRSCVLPAWYRLPFMQPDDVQIAATHTAPEARGQGLARAAVSAIVARFRAPGRTIWYFADQDNLASLRVIERCGFAYAGEGVRTRRHGLALLGQYVIEQPAERPADPTSSPSGGQPVGIPADPDHPAR